MAADEDLTSPARKTIALVAHDNMKDELLEWVTEHRDELEGHRLIGTGTTGRLVAVPPELTGGGPCFSLTRGHAPHSGPRHICAASPIRGIGQAKLGRSAGRHA